MNNIALVSNLRAIDIITREPVTVDAEVPISEVANIMARENVGSIIVMENGQPKGIITKGDIVRKVVATNKLPSKVLAKEVMSKPLHSISYDTTLEDAIKYMENHNCSHLAVFKGSKLVGVITFNDILHIAPFLIEYLEVSGAQRKIGEEI